MYWKCLSDETSISESMTLFVHAIATEIIEMQMQDVVKARNIQANAAIESNFVFVISNFSLKHVENESIRIRLCGVMCSIHAYTTFTYFMKILCESEMKEIRWSVWNRFSYSVSFSLLLSILVCISSAISSSSRMVLVELSTRKQFKIGKNGWISHTLALHNEYERSKQTLTRARTSINANKWTDEWTKYTMVRRRCGSVDAVNNILWRKDGSLTSTTERNKLNRKVWGAHIVLVVVESICEFELVSTGQWSLCKLFLSAAAQMLSSLSRTLSRCHPSKILHLSPANKHTKRWNVALSISIVCFRLSLRMCCWKTRCDSRARERQIPKDE